MATFAKKTKKRGGLGTPPPEAEVKGNLNTPETFDVPEPVQKKAGRPKSKRTVTFTTTLTPEFRAKLKKISYEEDKNAGEILEEAVSFWEQNKS